MENMFIIQLYDKFKMHFCAFSCFVTSNSPFLLCNGDKCIFKNTLKLFQKLLLDTDYKQMFMCIF